MPMLVIGNKEIPYKVRTGRGSNVLIRFNRERQLEVILPRGQKIDVEKVLKEENGWIKRKLEAISDSKRVFDRDRVLYKGKHYELSVDHSDDGVGRVDLTDGKIVVHAGKTLDLERILKNWMKEETTKYVVEKAKESAQKYGITLRNIYVRGISKWGLCTKKGDIVFNAQLIALPEDLAEYVVLHELAHLSEFNHSKRFKAKLAKMCPDFMEKRKKLQHVLVGTLLEKE